VQYMNKSKDRIKFCFYLLAIITGLIGIFVYLKSNGILNYMSSAEEFKKYIEGNGEKAYLVFFIVQFISVIIAPIPSNVSAVVGGTVFGMWGSFLISMLAIISGSTVVFVLGRRFGRAFAERFINPKLLNKYEQHFSTRKGELLLILLLLLPFFPDDAIGFVAGLSKISLRRYVIIMLLTRPWEILAASALGSSKIAMPLWVWGVLALVVICIAKNSDKIEKKLVAAVKAA
jgi:uncharacterized membrane protein YdjX (TVP38/TMEM64 family)